MGNALVMFCAYLVVKGKGVLTGADVAYWLTVASLVAVRYVDICYHGGTTAQCKPATTGHWRRYAVGIFILSLLVWLGAHGLGRLGR